MLLTRTQFQPIASTMFGTYARRMVAFVAVLSVVRLLVASHLNLAEDEAYYWLWSVKPAAGYFDAPPMVAWWIKVATLIFGNHEWAIRLPAILAAAAISWLAFKTSQSLFNNERLAAETVFWINGTLLLNMGSVLMTPDVPLCCFWSLAVYALARVDETGKGKWWLLYGLAAGGALLSKYTGFLLAPATLLWMLSSSEGRSWLLRYEPYAAAALALLMFMPVIFWNQSHGWMSFNKQWSHAASGADIDTLLSFSSFVGSQVGLITPLIFIFCILGVIGSLIRGYRRNDARWWLLSLMSLPIFTYFSIHSLTNKTEANWSAFLYPTAIIAAVSFWRLKPEGGLQAWSPWKKSGFKIAPVIGYALSALVFLQAITGVIGVPQKMDFTSRLSGWDDLAKNVEAQMLKNNADFIVTTEYPLTGLFSYYLPGRTVYEACERARYSDGLSFDDHALTGKTAIYAVNVRKLRLNLIDADFDDVKLVGSFQRQRFSEVIETYNLYLAKSYHTGERPWKC